MIYMKNDFKPNETQHTEDYTDTKTKAYIDCKSNEMKWKLFHMQIVYRNAHTLKKKKKMGTEEKKATIFLFVLFSSNQRWQQCLPFYWHFYFKNKRKFWWNMSTSEKLQYRIYSSLYCWFCKIGVIKVVTSKINEKKKSKDWIN